MADFNWKRFLDNRHIEYVTKGSSVARGNVAIHCPFCGDADQSFHLGISLVGKGWGCWRSTAHRGRRPHRLIQALTGCSYMEAAAIAGDADVMGSASDFDAMLTDLKGARGGVAAKGGLSYPKEIRPLLDRGMGRMFIDYLHGRLYSYRDAAELSELYDLRYCIGGPFSHRLIVPVKMPQGLVNWTGRAISTTAGLRYRTLSTDPAKAEADNIPQAILSIERTLWNMDQLVRDMKSHTLVVVEGPFDALRVDYLGYPEGIRGTCLFGKNLSAEQVELLDILSDYFERKIVLLDRDASLDQMSMQSRLDYLGFEFRVVPAGIKDPALFQRDDLLALCRGRSVH